MGKLFVWLMFLLFALSVFGVNELNWSKKSPKRINWNDAKRYCANLNENGCSNWRLPTISELRTLIKNCPPTEIGGECKVTDDCLSYNCRNKACSGCSSSSYGVYSVFGDTCWLWSSSEQSDARADAWGVLFNDGNISNYYEDGNVLNVRCLRNDSESSQARKHVEVVNDSKYTENLHCNSDCNLPKNNKLQDNSEMVVIPAGWFWMGCVPGDIRCSESEKPRHKVFISEFKIDKHEVTVGQYQACVEAGVCNNNDENNKHYRTFNEKDTLPCNLGQTGKEQNPMNCVNWLGAKAYCEFVGKRLPTDAEWEKAARGGVNGKTYPWGNKAPSCKYEVIEDNGGEGCGAGGTWNVCSKPENGYGLCDMGGNVIEWVNDIYDKRYYKYSDKKNPKGPVYSDNLIEKCIGCSPKIHHVSRGGALTYDVDFHMLRTSSRGGSTFGSSVYGFRCASDENSINTSKKDVIKQNTQERLNFSAPKSRKEFVEYLQNAIREESVENIMKLFPSKDLFSNMCPHPKWIEKYEFFKSRAKKTVENTFKHNNFKQAHFLEFKGGDIKKKRKEKSCPNVILGSDFKLFYLMKDNGHEEDVIEIEIDNPVFYKGNYYFLTVFDPESHKSKILYESNKRMLNKIKKFR